MGNPSRFTPEQDKLLRARYRELGPTALGERLGMNPERVYKRAALLGLVNHRDRNWTSEEDEVIRERYCVAGARGCLPGLPGRSERGVETRAAVLGVKTRNNTAAYDHRALASAFGMPAGAVVRNARMVRPMGTSS